MKKIIQNVLLNGIAVSEGLAEGPVWILPTDCRPADVTKMQSHGSRGAELELYDFAVRKALEDIETLTCMEASHDVAYCRDILAVYKLILTDPGMDNTLRNLIAKQGLTARQAIEQAYAIQIERFGNLSDPKPRTFVLDLYDICSRLLSALDFADGSPFESLKERSIVAALEISPTLLISLPSDKVLGIVCERGNILSHSAIIAASRKIPAVFNCDGLMTALHDEPPCTALLDAFEGEICLNPDAGIRNEWKKRILLHAAQKQQLDTWSTREAGTADGTRIHLQFNILHKNEMSSLQPNGHDGIGLLRTECLFMDSSILPGEEIQALRYSDIMHDAKSCPVVFRTFDIVPEKSQYQSDAPDAGRGLAFSLAHPDEFMLQLQAILRVSAGYPGDVSILFPLVNAPEQLRESFRLLDKAKKRLHENGQPYDPAIRIGAMIETPQAVQNCAEIMQMVDFACIGSNDLTRYNALDHNVPLYEASGYDPEVLRQIDRIVRTSESLGKACPVILCGEIATVPQALGLWLAMGIRRFSIAPHKANRFKQVLASCDLNRISDLVPAVLNQPDSAGVIRILNQNYAGWNSSLRRNPDYI